MTLLASLQMQTQKGQPRRRTKVPVHIIMQDMTLAGRQPLASYYSLHRISMSSSKLYMHVDFACLSEQLTAADLHLAQPEHLLSFFTTMRRPCKPIQVGAAGTEAKQQVVCKAKPWYTGHLHQTQHESQDWQVWQFWRQSLTQWQRKGVWDGCHQHYADPSSKEKPPDSSSPAHIALQSTWPAAFSLRVPPLGQHTPMQLGMQRPTCFRGVPQMKCRHMMTTH